MSEMIERVAWIIARADDMCSGEMVPCVPDLPGSPDECQCMRTARAGIAAMREPTKGDDRGRP